MAGWYDDGVAYNRYTNLDGAEWRIIHALASSKSKHAKNLWRMLKYNTSDCLIRDDADVDPTNVNYIANRLALVYVDTGVSDDKKVFMTPYVDDAWVTQSARLDVFVDSIKPTSNINSQVNIGIEIIVHNKINNIDGDASPTDPESNPSEIRNGESIIPYKSRATTMLKSVLAELNGVFIDGVGMLQHNMQINSESKTISKVWNNHAYLGFSVMFSTYINGVSTTPGGGW